MNHSIRISRTEFNGRLKSLHRYLKHQQLNGIVLFDNINILYFTGFAFIPTERPIAFALSANAERAMFVPRLEDEHAKVEAELERVVHYLEYPGNPPSSDRFKEMLEEMGMIEEDGRASLGMAVYRAVFRAILIMYGKRLLRR